MNHLYLLSLLLLLPSAIKSDNLSAENASPTITDSSSAEQKVDAPKVEIATRPAPSDDDTDEVNDIADNDTDTNIAKNDTNIADTSVADTSVANTSVANTSVADTNIAEPIKTLVLSPAPPSEYVQHKQLLSQQFRRDLPTQDEAKRKHKERKKRFALKQWLNEARKENLTISQMNFQQLLQRKNELLLEGDYEVALKYLEKMFKLTEHADQLVYIMLEWAELLMKTGQYAKAEKLFDDFIKLYPGNEYAEQAFVKAIECSWNQTASFDRDQTKTESTLKLITQFETRNAVYTQENIDRVMSVKEMCQQKLADSNLYVAKHYIGRGVYRSAHRRLDDARNTDLSTRPNIEPQLLKLEIDLAQAEKNVDIEQQKITELVKKFPQHEITLALKPEVMQKVQTT